MPLVRGARVAHHESDAPEPLQLGMPEDALEEPVAEAAAAAVLDPDPWR